MCGWVPLVGLIFAAGHRGGAVILTLIGNIWSVFLAAVSIIAVGRSGAVAPNLERELAGYVIVGGGTGALIGIAYAIWRWRTARRYWLIAGIGAAALAGISCAPAASVVGLGWVLRALSDRIP